MEDLTFLQYHTGDASLTVFLPDGNCRTIHSLDVNIIAERCPLLAMCFEQSHRGPHHSIEARSAALAISFLRYIYTGDYMPQDTQDWQAFDIQPCSLLIHAELCRLGDTFEAPSLIVQAHCNILRETEYACSKAQPPTDLAESIRFIYEHLSEQRELVDTLLNYCVSCFLYHKLAKNEEFKKVAYEVRAFHNDLCRTNFKRGFEDAGAIDIIRLPVRDSTQCEAVALGKAALGDFLYELWSDAATPQLGPSSVVSPEPSYALVHRPKNPFDNASVDDSDVSDGSLSDAEGFSLVHRPKGKAPATRDVFDDTETGWVGITEPSDKTAGFYMQDDLTASTDTIIPLLKAPCVPAYNAEESYSSDSDWSVVDVPVTSPLDGLGDARLRKPSATTSWLSTS